VGLVFSFVTVKICFLLFTNAPTNIFFPDVTPLFLIILLLQSKLCSHRTRYLLVFPMTVAFVFA
jgi:hypothetical protein